MPFLVQVLFRVGLVLLRSVLGSRSSRKKCPSLYETLDALKTAPSTMTDPEQMVEEVRTHQGMAVGFFYG